MRLYRASDFVKMNENSGYDYLLGGKLPDDEARQLVELLSPFSQDFNEFLKSANGYTIEAFYKESGSVTNVINFVINNENRTTLTFKIDTELKTSDKELTPPEFKSTTEPFQDELPSTKKDKPLEIPKFGSTTKPYEEIPSKTNLDKPGYGVAKTVFPSGQERKY